MRFTMGEENGIDRKLKKGGGVFLGFAEEGEGGSHCVGTPKYFRLKRLVNLKKKLPTVLKVEKGKRKGIWKLRFVLRKEGQRDSFWRKGGKGEPAM